MKGEIAALAPQRAVTVEGIFKIEPLYNLKGEAVQYYVLEQAKETQRSESHLLIWTIPCLAALFLAWKFYFKRMS